MDLTMISGEGKTARLRTRYTGEPKAAALHFYRRVGLRFGLIPDAVDAGQQRLEALLLRSLATPHPAFEELAVPGSVWGLTGASPYPDRLALWPASGQAAGLLARWLPTRTPAGELGGIPGLRAAAPPARRRDTLTLALAGRRAHIELRIQPGAFEEAVDLARGAGLEVLWEADTASRVEKESLGSLLADLPVSRAVLWSRALRRLGLARDVFAPWRTRDPLQAELEGPNSARIAPRPVGPGALFRGVVAVVSGDGRGGRGCTTAGYMLCAAAAAGGARVGFLAGDDPSNLLRLLGLDGAVTGWRDAGGQLGAGDHLKAALLETDADRAAQQLATAREEFDVVMVDAGSAFQYPRLAARADAVLVLVPDQVAWYDDEVVDERSPRVQIWSRLNSLSQQQWSSRRPGPELFVFLDEAFARYVEWRAEQEGLPLPQEDTGDDDPGLWDEEAASPGAGLPGAAGEDEIDDDGEAEEDDEGEDDDGWVEPYDPASPDDVDMFWAFEPVGGSAWAMLPPEEEFPYLGTWRREFLQMLTPEGERRHPDAWPDVLARWAERSRARNVERVPAGLLTAAETAAAEQEMIATHAEEALGRWSEELWRQESAAWLAAGSEQRSEVGDAEDDRLWTLRHPRPPQEVAEDLRHLVRHAPLGQRVVLAVNQPRQDLDRHLLEQVELALQQEQGIRALTVIPRDLALQAWVKTGRVDTPALTIGWALAEAVADALEGHTSHSAGGPPADGLLGFGRGRRQRSAW
ncbi:hypothetical protein [Streptomyces europaeiscabiei]|uniref:hypothetical protein n=1 Tax=Streptomyces europaeiscabiei TaxID=146819 RepID=UPI0038F6F827